MHYNRMHYDRSLLRDVVAFASVPVLLETPHGKHLFHLRHFLVGRVQQQRLVSERHLWRERQRDEQTNALGLDKTATIEGNMAV